LGALKEVSFRIWSPICWEVVEADVVCIVTNIVESTFLRQICASLGQILYRFPSKVLRANAYLYGCMSESVGMIWRQFSKIRVIPLRFNIDQWVRYLFHDCHKCSSIMRISDAF
jgi:hypothetical protein